MSLGNPGDSQRIFLDARLFYRNGKDAASWPWPEKGWVTRDHPISHTHRPAEVVAGGEENLR